jgi:hypothetical protein
MVVPDDGVERLDFIKAHGVVGTEMREEAVPLDPVTRPGDLRGLEVMLEREVSDGAVAAVEVGNLGRVEAVVARVAIGEVADVFERDVAILAVDDDVVAELTQALRHRDRDVRAVEGDRPAAVRSRGRDGVQQRALRALDTLFGLADGRKRITGVVKRHQ